MMRALPLRPRWTQVVTAAVVLLVGIIVGAAAWLLHDARSAAWDQAVRTSGNLAVTLEGDISRNVEIYNLALRAATKAYGLPDWAALSPVVQQSMLFDGAVQAGHFGAIMVTDASGRVIHASSTLDLDPISVADRDYFQEHQTNPASGLIVSLVPRNRLTGLPALQLSRRLNRPDGSFAGVVVGAINIGYVQGLFQPLELGESGMAALFMADGRLVTQMPPMDGEFGRPTGDPVLFRHLMEAPAGVFQSDRGMDGVPRVYSYRRVGALPIVLVVGASLDAVYADWVRKAWGFGAVLLAFTGLAALLALGLWRELGRRSRAERASRTSETRLQTYFDHLTDGLVVLRVELDGEFVLERLNEAAQAMLALPVPAATGGRFVEAWPADRGIGLLEHLRRSVTEQRLVRYEVSGSFGGRARTLQVAIGPVRAAAHLPLEDLAYRAPPHPADAGEPDGRIHLLLVSIRDVTERVQLEEQLRQSQRMEALGQLTAGVAHDFNNLLQAQMGSLELLLDELHDRPAAQEYAVTALQAGERGARLTHSLLAFSRKQMLYPQTIDLAAMLARFRLMLGRLLDAGTQVRVELVPGTSMPLADPAQLEAALLNLVLNARDAMQAGGSLTIEAYDGHGTPGVPAAVLARGGVVLAVTDTGNGMSPDTLSRACEPFFTTKGVRGSGLGLSMVQGFARQSGGELRIASSVGQGTRIEIWLPMAEPGLKAVIAANAGRARGEGTLLLVDDTPEVLATMADMLEESGFSVIQAGGADEALAVLAGSDPVDALLTDYAMPGMNGVELVHAATRLRPALRAMIVTGYTEADPRDRVPAGVRIINKPIRADALVRHVLDILPPLHAGAPGPAADGPCPVPLASADVRPVGAAPP